MSIEQEQFIFGSILLLANKLQVLGDSFLPDITLKQWFLLLMISKLSDKQNNINSIAKAMGSSRQNTKKMIDLLESKGYVSANQSVQDLRNLNVLLTDKTREYFIKYESLGNKLLNELFIDFTDTDLDTAFGFLQKLLKNADSFSPEEK